MPNFFNDRDTQRISNSVRYTEKQVQSQGTYRRRGRARASGATTPVDQSIFAGEITSFNNGKYTVTSLDNTLSVTGYPLQLNITSVVPTGTTVAVFADTVEAL